MATSAQELPEILASRRYDAPTVIDNWVRYEGSYREWSERVRTMDQVLRDEWDVVWPDNKRDRALPKVPNYPKLAMEHRGRLLAETMPTIACRSNDGRDNAKHSSEKRERIISGWWQRSGVNPFRIQQWGMDLMVTGLAVTKVLPDFSKPPAERFPQYSYVDPRNVYPARTFTPGPFVDDCIIAYESTLAAMRALYPNSVGELRDMENKSHLAASDYQRGKCKVYEFYSPTQVLVTIEPMYRSRPSRTPPYVTVVDVTHKIGKTPIAIGVRPTWDGVYRGDFDQTLAMLNTLNRMTTMDLDAAARKVYATLIVDEEVENPNDEGPGAVITVKSSQGGVNSHIGWLQHPASAYDGAQSRRQLDGALRTAVLLPPSVTGNPDESVVSAAGIAATQSMPNAEVVSLQRDSLAPMLQAANELAMRGDEQYGDTRKTITGVQRGAPFAETYQPSEDIKGNYQNEVQYGMGSGLDKVNLNVMLLQNKGEGMISDQTAREKSPFVDDPVAEKNRIATEQMEKAAFSAFIAGAAAPPGDPRALTLDQISAIWEDLEKPEGSLREAIKNHMNNQQAPLAPVPELAGPGLSSPGVAGAQEPQPPAFSGPPLEELLA